VDNQDAVDEFNGLKENEVM